MPPPITDREALLRRLKQKVLTPPGDKASLRAAGIQAVKNYPITRLPPARIITQR
jgi:hypothetical protein